MNEANTAVEHPQLIHPHHNVITINGPVTTVWNAFRLIGNATILLIVLMGVMKARKRATHFMLPYDFTLKTFLYYYVLNSLPLAYFNVQYLVIRISQTILNSFLTCRFI